MRYFIIAGERSGDMHASTLVRKIKTLDPQADFKGYGGDFMRSVGVEILSDYREANFMGFWEVLIHYRLIFRRINRCKNHINQVRPDVLVLVDYPSFNMRMAQYAHQWGIKTAYYISPKFWAWNTRRVEQVRKYVDLMCSIFPFEIALYKEHSYHALYVGNPTIEQVMSHEYRDLSIQGDYEKLIAVLPGSRKQEVTSSLSVIKEVAKKRPKYLFAIAAVSNLDLEVYNLVDSVMNLTIVNERTFELLDKADAAIVTSGTATLEAAMIGTPQLVNYRTSWVTYWLARLLVKIRFISLVNILAGEQVVKELVQGDFNASKVIEELELLLFDEGYSEAIKKGYRKVSQLLGQHQATTNAANAIVNLISKQPSVY